MSPSKGFALTERQKDNVHAQPPLVRLAAWHYDKKGRSWKLNRELANALKTLNLDGWTVEPAKTNDTAKDARDSYIPIEVELRYKTHSTRASTDPPHQTLRGLFYQDFPNRIRKFFSTDIGSTLQHINMYPVGEIASETQRKLYSHVLIENSLALEYQDRTEAGLVWEGAAMRTILDVIDAAPEVVGIAARVYVALKGLPKILSEGKSVEKELDGIQNMFKQTDSPRAVKGPEQRPALAPAPDAEKTTDMEKLTKSWNGLTVSSSCLESISQDIRHYIDKLFSGAGISDEELHLLVSQMRVSRIFLSTLQSELQSCRELLLAKHGSPNWYPFFVAAGLCIACGISIFFPPCAAFGGYLAGASAMVSGGYASKEAIVNYKQLKNGDAAVALDEMVGGLSKAFGDAHLAAAAMLCNQVFKVPLDTMNLDEQKSLLKDLGIDMSQIRDMAYTEELVADRLKVLSLKLEEYKHQRTKVGEQAGLKELRLALSP